MHPTSHRKHSSIDLEFFTASGSRPLSAARPRSRDGGRLQKRENQLSEEGGSWPWGVAF